MFGLLFTVARALFQSHIAPASRAQPTKPVVVVVVVDSPPRRRPHGPRRRANACECLALAHVTRFRVRAAPVDVVEVYGRRNKHSTQHTLLSAHKLAHSHKVRHTYKMSGLRLLCCLLHKRRSFVRALRDNKWGFYLGLSAVRFARCSVCSVLYVKAHTFGKAMSICLRVCVFFGVFG